MALSRLHRLRWFLQPGIFAVHRIDPENVGDMSCCPLDYFDCDRPVYRHGILALRQARLLWRCQSPLILGGGGVFVFPDIIQQLLQNYRGQIIYWGIGQNRHYDGIGGGFQTSDSVRLMGIRDWGTPYDWVPCASCLSPLFEEFRHRQPEHEIVIYDHAKHPVGIPGMVHLANSTPDLREVLAFLASGDTVLTSSYHGAYWAQLLGRRVVVFPFSDKFDAFRFPAPKASVENWRERVREARAFPESLDICRQANLRFAGKVSDVLKVQLHPRPALQPVG